MLMTPCRRCGVEYDFDADRRMNPHGHGAEPNPYDHPAGTRVRVLKATHGYAVGDLAMVHRYSPPHHVQNGGGYTVDLGAATYIDVRSYHLEVLP